MSQSCSLIIITYKRPAEVQGALENMLQQGRAPDEILIVDNDPEQSAAAIPGRSDPRVRYFAPGENLGPAAGRNYAAERATGDILLFLDDDCRFDSPDALAETMARFADPQVDFVTYLVRNAFSGQIVPYEYPGYSTAQWDQPHLVSYFIGCGFAVRRDVFRALDGFDPVLFYCEEELDFSFRLIHAGHAMHYLPLLIHHRVALEGREQRKRAYRLIRNRIYLALKHLPFPFILSHLVVWGGFSFMQALRGRELSEFARGLASVWRDGLWGRALQYRRAHRMTRPMLHYLRRHEGRLWY